MDNHASAVTEDHGSHDAAVFVVVDIGGRRCALPADRVVEIHPAVQPTPLPQAPDAVLGVIDRRGEVVAVIDTWRRLSLPTRPLVLSDSLVIVETRERRVALPVDAALDVSLVAQGAIDTAISRAGASIASGVAALPDGLAVIVDVDAFLTSEEFAALDDAIAAATAPAG